MRLKEETVWLTLRQMATLFERDLSDVSRHIRNVYREGDLEREATFAKFATVRREGGRSVLRQIEHFNLDVIISVNYRVKSLRGTQFRQWAARTLREHLVRGYTVNERRVAERGLREARETLDLLARTLRSQSLVSGVGEAVLELQGHEGIWSVSAPRNSACLATSRYDVGRRWTQSSGLPDP